MPVLRMPADTSLGDTLGSLGRSFSENFNPLNQLRAYDIQQQMWMRQQQLLQLQRENQARQAAIQQWGNLVPADKLPQIALMIYQNAPYDQVARAAAEASGQLIDKTDPESIQKNIAFMEHVTGKAWTDPYPPYAGEVTGAYIRQKQAEQAGAVSGAQETARLGAETSRRAGFSSRYIDADTPEARASNLKTYIEEFGKAPDDGLTPPVTPIMQQIHDAELEVRNTQMKYGDVMGSSQAKAALATQLVDDPTGAHDAANRVILTAINGAPPDPKTIAPAGPKTSALAEQQRNQQTLETAAATKRGELVGEGGPKATDTTLPAALPNLPPVPGQPPAPTPAAPAALPAPVVSGRPIPNNPGMVINGYRVTAAPSTSGGMIGAVPGAPDAAQKLTETYYKSLNDAYTAGGEPVAKLRDTIGQLQNLSNLAQTGGVYGQWTSTMRDRAKALGFGDITTAQQAQTAMDNLLKTLIPELKSDYNLNRVAQPEIALLSKVTGSADLTPAELANILANLRTGTDLSEALRSQASRALGLSSDPTPFDYPDYAKFEGDSFNKYSQVADQNRVDYGAIGARLDARTPTQQSAPTPPAQQPVQTPPDQLLQANPAPAPVQQSTGNPILDFLGSIGHIFGGGAPAPAPAPAPNSRELIPGQDF